METTTIHPAEAYLRNAGNPPYLYVRIGGKRRQGYYFSNWTAIEKIYYPTAEKEETDINRRLILKYQRLAKFATHSNSWLQKIAAADLTKSPYENHITAGTKIDGQCIRLSTIEKYCGSVEMRLFKEAVKQGKKFSTVRFDFCGYDGTLWCEPGENGEVTAGFSKEYRGCLNGYYYLLINDEYMIGYDVD